MNATSEIAPAEEKLEMKFWVILPFIILILTTCTANCLVILVTTTDSKLHGVTYMYVTSLAIADFMVGFVVMSGMMIYTMYDYWPLNSALCTIWQVFDFAMCSVSMLHLCLIAFDRFLATVYPLSTYLQEPNIKVQRARFKIALAWLFGITIWLPAIVIIRDQQLKRDIISQDDCDFLPSKIYSIVQAVIGYYIPILVVVYFYLRVTHTLYQRNVKKKTMKKNIAKMFSSPKHKMCKNVMLHESNPTRKEHKQEKPLQFDDIMNVRTKHKDHHCCLSRQINRAVSEKAIKGDTISNKNWRTCSLPSRWPKPDGCEEYTLQVVGTKETARQKFSHVNVAFEGDSQENIAEKDSDYILNKNLETIVEHVMKEGLSIKKGDEVLPCKRKTISCTRSHRCSTLIRENMKKRSNSICHYSFTGGKEICGGNNVAVSARGWNTNGKSATAVAEVISNNENDNTNNYVKRVGEFKNGEDSTEALNKNDRKQSVKTISNIELQDMVHFDAQGMVTNIIKIPPRKKYLEMSVPFKKEQAPNSQLTQRAQHIQHRRITRTLGIIILVFLICWLPFCIAWPLNTFCECINVRFYDFTYWAAYINSTLNPFLYFAINRDFRSALSRVMMKYFSKPHINRRNHRID